MPSVWWGSWWGRSGHRRTGSSCGRSVGPGLAGTRAQCPQRARAVAPEGFPALVVLMVVVTWQLMGRVLAPVESIRATFADITAKNLHRRVPEPVTHDEVARLARTKNVTLGQRTERAVHPEDQRDPPAPLPCPACRISMPRGLGGANCHCRIRPERSLSGAETRCRTEPAHAEANRPSSNSQLVRRSLRLENRYSQGGGALLGS